MSEMDHDCPECGEPCDCGYPDDCELCSECQDPPEDD